MKITVILSSLIIAIGLALSGGVYKFHKIDKDGFVKARVNTLTGDVKVVSIRKIIVEMKKKGEL